MTAIDSRHAANRALKAQRLADLFTAWCADLTGDQQVLADAAAATDVEQWLSLAHVAGETLPISADTIRLAVSCLEQRASYHANPESVWAGLPS